MIGTINGVRFCGYGIPRTATSSIHKALFLSLDRNDDEWPEKHTPRNTLSIDDRFMFTFCLCRNPFHRMVSMYEYGIQLTERPLWKGLSFGEWITGWVPKNNTQFVKPMRWWISDENGISDVDFTGRFESLNQSWDYIRSRLGITRRLPHCKKTIKGGSYYEPSLVETVVNMYLEDFQFFGYSTDYND